MKNFLLVAAICPAVFLLFGYNGQQANVPTVLAQPVVLNEMIDPVAIQVENQGFPFDVDGNFPYVVMVDNVVWTFKKEDVKDFLLKVKSAPAGPGHGRVRMAKHIIN